LAYCTTVHVSIMLARALTSSSPRDSDFPSGRVDLIRIGNTLDSNMVTTEIVNQFIAWADNDINADISVLYQTPVAKTINYEAALYGDIDLQYNPYIVLENIGPFSVGDEIILTDGTHEETHVIAAIDGNVIETEDAITYPFSASDTRVLRISYPFPLTQCSARITSGNIYDKYFAAQSDPNVSEYGKFLRKQARQDIDNILNGRTVLHGAVRIGRRFFNPNLMAQYPLAGVNQGGAMDIDDLG